MSTLQPDIAPGQELPDPVLLDLFSIRQSFAKKCINNAPYVCIPPDGEKPGFLCQCCCNDWLCPKCGQARARHEYGRMVVGAREIAKQNPLYMMSLTLPGTISLEDGERTYYEKTNRLMTNMRYYAKQNNLPWHYAAVTERQGRGHPHSHLLTSFCPLDAFYMVDDYERYTLSVQRVNEKIPPAMRFSPEPLKDIDHRQMFSEWLSLASVKAGLGVQCRIAVADLVEGASRYMAKYLFKTAMFESWPPKWRRVRYSRNWPKMPEFPTTSAFPVLSAYDWMRVANLPGTIKTHSLATYEHALLWRCLNVAYDASNPIELPTK